MAFQGRPDILCERHGYRSRDARWSGKITREPRVPRKIHTRAACASAPVKFMYQRGASPRREEVWLLEAEGNCVAARRGGEQPEANGSSATQVNSIRPVIATSLLAKGEVEYDIDLREWTGFTSVYAVKLDTSKPKSKYLGDGGWLEAEGSVGT